MVPYEVEWWFQASGFQFLSLVCQAASLDCEL